jgi:hypothetical protein
MDIENKTYLSFHLMLICMFLRTCHSFYFDLTDWWIDDIDVNMDGNGSTPRIAPSTSQKAECVFLSKNSSLRALIALSVGLTNVDDVDLIVLEVNPWKSLPTNTAILQKENYAKETSRRYVTENPNPSNGIKKKCSRGCGRTPSLT